MAKLLTLIVALTAVLTSACGMPHLRSDVPLGALARKCPEGTLERSERLATEARLQDQYGIKVAAAEAPCRGSSVRCRAVESQQGRTLAHLYQLMDSEFSRYPEGFLREHGPKEIWIVNDLYSGTRREEVAGYAFYASRVVYLAVPSLCSDESFRHTIQHELFHVFDPQIVAAYAREEAWAALNPGGVKYAGFDEGALNRSEDRPLGFASSYGQLSQFEDRAELFSLGVVAPWSFEQKNLASQDTYLSQKRRTLAAWMSELWPETKLFLDDISMY